MNLLIKSLYKRFIVLFRHNYINKNKTSILSVLSTVSTVAFFEKMKWNLIFSVQKGIEFSLFFSKLKFNYIAWVNVYAVDVTKAYMFDIVLMIHSFSHRRHGNVEGFWVLSSKEEQCLGVHFHKKNGCRGKGRGTSILDSRADQIKF